MRKSLCFVAAVLFLLVGAAGAPTAQPGAARVTAPRAQFGHDIGDDYVLVNYTRYVEYLQKLDRESDRMIVVDIGKTAEGRTEYTAIVTSPDNHRQLAKYKDINRRLALAEGVSDEQARQLSRDGKVVVWIDGGLHATEVLGAQQLIETIYRLNSRTDAETLQDPGRHHRAPDAGEPGRHGAGVRLVHARAGADAPLDGRSPAPVSEVHRPRQQPRLLHDESAGKRERQPDDVPRVVPGHHVQPSSDRTGRRRPVCAAISRSVQLPLRSAHPARHRHGGRGHPHAAGRREQAGRRDALRRDLLDLVQRRAQDHLLLPQSDRHPHRDDREPDTGRHPVRARDAAAGGTMCPTRSRRSGGTSSSRSSTR